MALVLCGLQIDLRGGGSQNTAKICMTEPTLSVVIPNYNHGKYLAGCLEAILAQSRPAQEVIVVDDGSTDNSVEILEGLARQHPTLKVFRNEVNRGALYTINRGIDLAKGDFLSLAAADDQVMPGFFEKSMALLARHPHAGLSATTCRFRDMESGLVYHLGSTVSKEPCFLPPDQVVEACRSGKLIVFTSTMILRREALIQAGKYLPELRWHGDWFAYFVVACRHGVCIVPEVLAEFRVFSSGFSKKGMRNTKDQMAVLRKAVELLESDEYRDVAGRFREATLLAPFGKEMLRVLLSERRFWKYLTPVYLRQALWWTIRIEAKKVLPRFAVKLYFKMAGYGK